MPTQLGLPTALRRRGLTIELVPGWETRGSASFNPGGSVCHWTAGPKTGDRPSLNICVNGRKGLPGPLCNVFLTRAGIAVVVSGNRANHAGAGGWRGLAGNSAVWGTEAESAGTGDWTAAQRVAYPKINAAFADLSRFSAEMVCGHHEWATPAGRKIDVRDWPMSTMRASVHALLTNAPIEEDDMPFTDRQLRDIVGQEVTKLLPAIRAIVNQEDVAVARSEGISGAADANVMGPRMRPHTIEAMDASKMAEAIIVQGGLSSLSNEDVRRLAVAVLDERDRRDRSELTNG